MARNSNRGSGSGNPDPSHAFHEPACGEPGARTSGASQSLLGPPELLPPLRGGKDRGADRVTDAGADRNPSGPRRGFEEREDPNASVGRGGDTGVRDGPEPTTQRARRAARGEGRDAPPGGPDPPLSASSGDDRNDDDERGGGRERTLPVEEVEPCPRCSEPTVGAARDENNDDDGYRLMLEEEDNQRRQWLEEIESHRAREEESELHALLDDQMRLFREIYPDDRREEGGEGVDEESILEDEGGDEDEDLFLQGEVLRGDGQIEDLVAFCESRDREQKQRSGTTHRGTTAFSEGCAHAGQPFGHNTTGIAAATNHHGVCVVCLAAPRTHAYVPCGHLCVCQSCARHQLKQQRKQERERGGTGLLAPSCPVCRQPSAMVVKIFVP